MEKKQDLRVVKTLEAIKKAFFGLLEEKVFESIKIKDITEKHGLTVARFTLITMINTIVCPAMNRNLWKESSTLRKDMIRQREPLTSRTIRSRLQLKFFNTFI